MAWVIRSECTQSYSLRRDYRTDNLTVLKDFLHLIHPLICKEDPFGFSHPAYNPPQVPRGNHRFQDLFHTL
jgi:hypothetical protein